MPSQTEAKETSPCFILSLNVDKKGTSPIILLYLDPETAKLVKELSNNPDLRTLIDASRKLAPADVKNITNIVAKMKKKENHEND